MNGFLLCDQPVCSLYAVGKITGTVVDLGYANTGTVTYLLIDMPTCNCALWSPKYQAYMLHLACSLTANCHEPLTAFHNASPWSSSTHMLACFLPADVSVVAEGQVNYHNTKRLPYGGRDLDAFLVSLLKQRGVHCSDPQNLKEMCARASAPDSEVSN